MGTLINMITQLLITIIIFDNTNQFLGATSYYYLCVSVLVIIIVNIHYIFRCIYIIE